MEKYLIDTNVFLEIFLKQELSENCKIYLISKIDKIAISDFSLHSIGVILFRLKKHDQYYIFLNDVLPKIGILGLPLNTYESIKNIAIKYNLYFDDAYQTAIAKHYGLTITTLDKDFNKIILDYKVEFIKN